MKKTLKVFIAAVLTATLMAPTAGMAYASTKTDAEKVLKYYKQGNIKKAKQYNKKLPKKASTASIKRLSSKAKSSFLKVVKSYNLNTSIYSKKPYIWGYYLVDMDGDKKAELLVQYGTCEADVRTAVYKYKNGKAKRVARTFSGHTAYYAYPGHSGVIAYWAHMGNESISVTKLKNGKLKSVGYGGRIVNSYSSFFPLRQPLNGHIKYDANYKRTLDLKDLS